MLFSLCYYIFFILFLMAFHLKCEIKPELAEWRSNWWWKKSPKRRKNDFDYEAGFPISNWHHYHVTKWSSVGSESSNKQRKRRQSESQHHCQTYPSRLYIAFSSQIRVWLLLVWSIGREWLIFTDADFCPLGPWE